MLICVFNPLVLLIPVVIIIVSATVIAVVPVIPAPTTVAVIAPTPAVTIVCIIIQASTKSAGTGIMLFTVISSLAVIFIIVTVILIVAPITIIMVPVAIVPALLATVAAIRILRLRTVIVTVRAWLLLAAASL